MYNKSIKPKLGNQKRPVNPEAKLAGFKDYAYLALHQNVLAFPDRPILTETMEDAAYVTAITNVANAGKPFGATTFARVEVIKNSIKLNSEGDFSKNNTAVKSTVELMVYGDKSSKGFAAKLKGADVSVILPSYDGDMTWMGDKEVPAKVVKFAYTNDVERKDATFTVEFEPYETLFLENGSQIDVMP
jgi:hypothetical protein